MPGGEALEGGLQIGVGLDTVHLAGGDQRGDAGPVGGALVVTGEETVLAGEGLGTDQIFDPVGVQLDPAARASFDARFRGTTAATAAVGRGRR
jgi:hypothetical protein